MQYIIKTIPCYGFLIVPWNIALPSGSESISQLFKKVLCRFLGLDDKKLKRVTKMYTLLELNLSGVFLKKMNSAGSLVIIDI